jgi:hypothetical protein
MYGWMLALVTDTPALLATVVVVVVVMLAAADPELTPLVPDSKASPPEPDAPYPS